MIIGQRIGALPNQKEKPVADKEIRRRHSSEAGQWQLGRLPHQKKSPPSQVEALANGCRAKPGPTHDFDDWTSLFFQPILPTKSH